MSFRSLKGPERVHVTDVFYECERDKELPGLFRFIHIEKTVHLQQLKEHQRSKLGT